MKHVKHFTLWLLKRIFKVVFYGPMRVHEYFVEQLEEEWIPAVFGFIFAGFAMVLVSVGVFICLGISHTEGALILVKMSIPYGIYFVLTVIQVQYRIYCNELEYTMTMLKKDHSVDEEPPF